MSWDLFLMRGPQPTRGQFESPEFRPEPIGSHADIRNKITVVLPQVEWGEDGNGKIQRDEYGIHFIFDDDEPVETVSAHVYGNGNPLEVIVPLCEEHGWIAFDTTTGEFIDLGNPYLSGFEAFQRGVKSGRQQVAGEGHSEKPSQATVLLGWFLIFVAIASVLSILGATRGYIVGLSAPASLVITYFVVSWYAKRHGA